MGPFTIYKSSTVLVSPMLAKKAGVPFGTMQQTCMASLRREVVDGSKQVKAQPQMCVDNDDECPSLPEGYGCLMAPELRNRHRLAAAA